MSDALERHKRTARHVAFHGLLTWAARASLVAAVAIAMVRGAHWILIGGAFYILLSWARPGPDSDL